jgi:hypothetical protein
LLLSVIMVSNAWVLPATCIPRTRVHIPVVCLSTPNDIESDENQVTKSFDEAGQGLRDQEDSRRMEEAGDFDSNPAVSVSCCC